MALFKGSLKFIRCKVEGFGGFPSSQDMYACFNRKAFRCIEPGEMKSFGFSEMINPCSFGEFHEGSLDFLDWVAFVFHKEERKVSSAAINGEVEKRVFKQGFDSTTRKKKKELREQVREEFLLHAKAIPTFVQVCWNIVTGDLIFFSSSVRLFDEFKAVFLDVIGKDCSVRMLDGFYLIQQANGAVEEADDFLTWLWHKTSTNQFAEFNDASLSVGSSLKMVNTDDETSISTHNTVEEARYAITSGMEVKAMELYLTRGGSVIEFKVTDDMIFTGVKLPKVEAELSVDELAFVMDNILFTFDTMVVAFLQYASERSAPNWNEAKKALFTWSKGDICMRQFDDL